MMRSAAGKLWVLSGALVLACAALCSAGCETMRVDTHTVDPTFPFGKIHTYAWAEFHPIGIEGSPPDSSAGPATRPTSAAASQPGPVADTPGAVTAIRDAIEESLARKGYVKAPPGAEPDFYIASRAMLAKRVVVEPGEGASAPMYVGPNSASDPGYRVSPAVSSPTVQSAPSGGDGSRTAREFDQGELVLEVIDPVTNIVVWRGMAADRINTRADFEKKQGLVDRAVNKMLAEFPPKPKQK